MLYCHISAFAEDFAVSFIPDAVISLADTVTVGAERSMASSETVVDAVIVPIGVPEYVPSKRHDAESDTPVFVPSELWFTLTVFVFNSFECCEVDDSEIAGTVKVSLVPFIDTVESALSPTYKDKYFKYTFTVTSE